MQLARKAKLFYKLDATPVANGNGASEKIPLDMKIEEETLAGTKPEKGMEKFEEEIVGEDMKPLTFADFCKYPTFDQIIWDDLLIFLSLHI